jgi:hypothetical protein
MLNMRRIHHMLLQNVSEARTGQRKLTFDIEVVMLSYVE